ncbi:hypothetical protein D3C73_1003160 [compost metagenome]
MVWLSTVFFKLFFCYVDAVCIHGDINVAGVRRDETQLIHVALYLAGADDWLEVITDPSISVKDPLTLAAEHTAHFTNVISLAID